jgi:hypothetical protein
MVMLLTGLMVAFMMRAGSEKQSSGFYRAEATTRELSDTTLNLAEGLINEATTQTSSTPGVYYSWASQPGAIRVFDNINGTTSKIFKLYSAQSMVKSVTSNNDIKSFLTADAPPAAWYTTPGSWVDLNAPVNVDPNPKAYSTSLGAAVMLGQATYTHFPILDPRPSQNLGTTLDQTNPTTGAAYMDGFSITGAPTDTSNSANSEIDVNPSSKPEASPVPMPVQWLYVLQDGTMTVPNSTPDASGNYSFASSAPSVTNPIVGRIAFWTDDETCKVNINTAGADGVMNDKNGTPKNLTPDKRVDPSAIAEGTFWSVPRFAATDDAAETVDAGAPGSGPFLPGCCSAQPVAGEYQRYPGHPATVALSNILNGLGVTINTTTFYNPSTLGTGAQSITGYGFTPRYVFGGSQENTVDTFNANPYNLPGYNAGTGINTNLIPTSPFRLYPTLSEALFRPDRTTATPLNTASSSDTSSRQRMESARFFLTAHSRAPELNLFGLPRVNMWPLSNTTSNFSAVDQLLAFCSTIGGKGSGDTYYFSRKTAGGSYDSTVDIGITRNVALLKYLDYLTKQNVPGYSQGTVGSVSFATKNYGGGLVGQNDQILSEIFDYIRTTNLQDPNSPSPYNLSPAYNGGGYSAGPPSWQSGGGGQNQVVPDLATPTVMGGSWSAGSTTQGYGSFPRLVEVTIQFVAMGKGGIPPTTPGGSDGVNAIPISPAEIAYAFPNPNPPPNILPAPPPAVASPAYGAFAGNNPLGAFIGYPSTPQVPQGDAPLSGSLTYAYVPLKAPSTTPAPTATNPYSPPGAVDPVYSPSPLTYPFSAPPPTGPYNTIYRVHNYSTGLDSGIPPDGTTAVQAFLYLTFVNPAQGWTYTGPYVWITMTGQSAITFGKVSGTQYPAGFSDPEAMVFQSDQNIGGGRSGYYPLFGNYQYYNLKGYSGASRPYCFPFFSKIIPISNIVLDPTKTPTMSFTGGPLVINLYDAPNGSGPLPLVTALAGDLEAPKGGHLIQTYTVPFFTSTTNVPLPYLPPNNNSYPPLPATAYTLINNPTPCYITPNVAYGTQNPPAPPAPTTYSVTAFELTGPIIGVGEPAGAVPMYDRWRNYNAGFGQGPPILGAGDTGSGDTIQSMVLSQIWSDPRLLAISTVPSIAWVQHPSTGQQFAHNLFTSGPMYPLTGNAGTGTLAGNLASVAYPYWGGTWPWAPAVFGASQPTTVSGAPPDWDNGVSFGSDGPWINKADEGSNPYNGLPYYGNPVVQQTAFFSPNRQVYSPGMFGSLPTGVDPTGTKPARWQTLLFRPGPGAANAIAAANGIIQTSGPAHPGEGVPVNAAYSPPYITLPDHLWMDLFWMPIAEPYPISEPMSTAGKINMNYQILPFTYIKRATALRAAMATEKIAEVGLDQPQEKGPGGYLNGLYVDGVITQNTVIGNLIPARYPVDLDVTMTQFDAKFDLTNTTTGCDIFRSASQICEMFLVPMDIPNQLPHGGTPAQHSTGTYEELIGPSGNYSPISTVGVANFALDWYIPVTGPTTNAPYALVGDNVREEPYGRLYGKLTTKSNTFTVYYRVQSLKKPAAVAVNQWNENLGTITGEYRGSTTIERFIDPNEGTTSGGTFTPTIPDAASQVGSGVAPTSLEAYYKWRVVENHQFAP